MAAKYESTMFTPRGFVAHPNNLWFALKRGPEANMLFELLSDRTVNLDGWQVGEGSKRHILEYDGFGFSSLEGERVKKLLVDKGCVEEDVPIEQRREFYR